MRRPARASLADVPVLRNDDRAVAGRPRRRAAGRAADDHLGQRRNPARAAIRAPRCGRLAVERADAGTRTPDPIITSESGACYIARRVLHKHARLTRIGRPNGRATGSDASRAFSGVDAMWTQTA